MLAVAKVHRGREAYYLATVPGEDRAAGLVEDPGRWLGRAADHLGLDGAEVDGAALSAALSGRHPRSGEALDPHHGRVRVVAFDCTFSCPKSVSLLERLGPGELAGRAAAAHEAAVASAVGYLEREAAAVRRSAGGERRVEPAEGFLAASFLHRASRAPDPHLHSHVLVANLARDGAGRWSALDSRQLYLELSVAGALYEAELRGRLSAELGVAWRRRPHGGFELAGLPERLVGAFSQRSAAISAEMRAGGFASPQAARLAALRTRPPKDLDRPMAELAPAWRQRALGLGLAGSRWRRVAPQRPLAAASAAGTALAALEERFDRRTLLEAAARASVGGATIEALEREVDGLLADAGLVHPLGAAASRLGRGAERFPSGTHRPSYATQRTATLEAGLERLVEHAVPLARLADAFPAFGVVLATMGGDPAAPGSRGDVLARRVAATLAEGRPISAIAAGEEAARWLAGAAGLPVRAADRTQLPRRRGVTLLAGAERLGQAALVGLTSSALDGRGTVVLLVEGGPSRSGPASRACRRLSGAAFRLDARASGREQPGPSAEPAGSTPAIEAIQRRLRQRASARKLEESPGPARERRAAELQPARERARFLGR